VRQALDNVVRNAVRRATRVELTSRVEDRFGVVEVSDDGPGFDPAILPEVFDRYRRGDRRGETGIGLAIVKAIVEANGGSVEVANRGGDGTGTGTGGAVVRIALPLDR
jgi:signal transduction histidine kinase